MNHNIQRLHIEQLILVTYLNQNKAHILDEIELRDTKLPFELFKANKTIKMIAKAIYNLQNDNKPIDEDIVLNYIQQFTEVNTSEWIDINCKLWVSFDTMNIYLDYLKAIDKEEEKMRMLGMII
jgi:hypothetical protein